MIEIQKEISSVSDLESQCDCIVNNKKGTYMHTIKSKLKIIKYLKQSAKKKYQKNILFLNLL